MKDVIESAEKAEASPEDELGGGGWGLGWLMGRGGGKRTRKRDANKTWGEWLTGLVFGDVQVSVVRLCHGPLLLVLVMLDLSPTIVPSTPSPTLH